MCLPASHSTLADHTLFHTTQHSELIRDAPDRLNEKDLNDFFSQYSDVYMCKDSFKAATLSCGGAISVCRVVCEGRAKNGFALIR